MSIRINFTGNNTKTEFDKKFDNVQNKYVAKTPEFPNDKFVKNEIENTEVENTENDNKKRKRVRNSLIVTAGLILIGGILFKHFKGAKVKPAENLTKQGADTISQASEQTNVLPKQTEHVSTSVVKTAENVQVSTDDLDLQATSLENLKPEQLQEVKDAANSIQATIDRITEKINEAQLTLRTTQFKQIGDKISFTLDDEVAQTLVNRYKDNPNIINELIEKYEKDFKSDRFAFVKYLFDDLISKANTPLEKEDLLFKYFNVIKSDTNYENHREKTIETLISIKNDIEKLYNENPSEKNFKNGTTNALHDVNKYCSEQPIGKFISAATGDKSIAIPNDLFLKIVKRANEYNKLPSQNLYFYDATGTDNNTLNFLERTFNNLFKEETNPQTQEEILFVSNKLHSSAEPFKYLKYQAQDIQTANNLYLKNTDTEFKYKGIFDTKQTQIMNDYIFSKYSLDELKNIVNSTFENVVLDIMKKGYYDTNGIDIKTLSHALVQTFNETKEEKYLTAILNNLKTIDDKYLFIKEFPSGKFGYISSNDLKTKLNQIEHAVKQELLANENALKNKLTKTTWENAKKELFNSELAKQEFEELKEIYSNEPIPRRKIFEVLEAKSENYLEENKLSNHLEFWDKSLVYLAHIKGDANNPIPRHEVNNLEIAFTVRTINGLKHLKGENSMGIIPYRNYLKNLLDERFSLKSSGLIDDNTLSFLAEKICSNYGSGKTNISTVWSVLKYVVTTNLNAFKPTTKDFLIEKLIAEAPSSKIDANVVNELKNLQRTYKTSV